MKKYLISLLVLVMTLLCFVACGDDETSKDDSANKRPDYGTATVYAPGDSVLLITSDLTTEVFNLRGAMDEFLVRGNKGGLKQGSIYTPNQELELLIQVKQEDESRPILATAQKYLERIEQDSYFDQRYVVYADSGQIVICYDENEYTNLQVADYVIREFTEKYVAGREYLALPKGVVMSGSIDLIALQEDIDRDYLVDQWNELEEAAKKKYGDVVGEEIVDAFRTYYSMIDDRVVGWWANMYDPGIGGFYGTASGRDHLGYLPNIEGTGQILSHLSSSGMLDTLGGSAAKALPDIMKYQIVYYYKSLQNPTNGYFYNPQLGIAGTTTYRLGRDQGRCTSWLASFGSAPTYDHPTGVKGDGITADEYWDDLVANGLAPESARPYVPKSLEDYEQHITGKLGGESAAVAVSKIALTASEDASVFLSSFEEFDIWLQGYASKIDSNPYSACSNINATYKQIEGAARKLGKSDDSTKWYYGMDFCEMVIKVLNDHINDRGLFGAYTPNPADPFAGCKYANTNGLMKSIPIYNAWGIAYPEPLKAVEGCLLGIQSDEESKSNICETYNIWEAMSGVISNVKNYGTEEQKKILLGYWDDNGTPSDPYDDFEVVGTVYASLGEFGPASIINTYNKQSRYQCEDGGFSHNISTGVKENGGCPIGLGLKEANVDANGFGMQSVINAMLSCFDLRSYQVPLFTEADWMRFLEMVFELDPVIKYSYDEESGNSSIDKVFTFEDGMPAQGFTISNVVAGNSHAVVDEVGKDGEKGIFRFTKAVNGSNTNPGIVTNATVKSVSASMTTFEFDIRLSNITSKAEIEIKLGTLSKTSAKQMPLFVLLSLKGTADGSIITYRDYANGAAAGTAFDTPAKVGEWFTVKVEYYEGDKDTFRFRTYINGELIYTSNSLYSQAIYAGAEAVPDASEIQRAAISVNSNFKGTFDFDNFSLIQSTGTIDDMGVGRPGSTVVPEEKPDEPDVVVPDIIPEGITTPAAADAVKFDTIPDKSVTKITSQDFLNTYFLTATTAGDKVLYIDKKSHIDSNSGVIFNQYPTKIEADAKIAIFEADYYISGYEQVEVIQFTLSGKTAGNDNTPYMILLKADGKDRGSTFKISNQYWDVSQSKYITTEAVNTGAQVGSWFRFRIEYEVTATDASGVPTAIEYRAYVNNKLVLQDTRARGKNIYSGAAVIPSVVDISTMNFSFNASNKGRFAVDNFSFRKLVANDYVAGDLVIPDPTIGSGFDAPEGAITFDEKFEDMVAAGTVKVDLKESTQNTFAVVDKNGAKMLQMVKTEAGKQEVFEHHVSDAAGSYKTVVYEAVLAYAPAVGSTTQNFEFALHDEATDEKIVYTLINFGGADGALRIQAYKRVASGTTNSGFKSPSVAVKAGEFFKIRCEYIVGETVGCTKIYINDELLIDGDYYSGTKVGDAYTDTPYDAVGYAVLLNYGAFQGETYIDYSYIKTEAAPAAPVEPEKVITFDQAYEDALTIVTNANYADKNTWTVVDVEGDKKLYVQKQGKDTSGTTYLGGVSFQIGVTEREINPTIMVYEFDMQIKDATAFDNQITMGHQGVAGNTYTPFLYSLSGLKANTDYHITFTYKVTATDASGIPTAIEYTVYVNDNDPITSNTVHPKATKLKVNGGTYELPTVAQVESVTFALNNSFLGNVYLDNFRLALLAEWAPEVPEEHEHVYVDGKCECGAEDPDYVADPVIRFDEIPENLKINTDSTSGVIVVDPKNEENKVIAFDPTYHANTKVFRLQASDIPADAEVAVFEGKVLVVGANRITMEWLFLNNSQDAKATRATFIYLNNSSATFYENTVSCSSATTGIALDTWYTVRMEYRRITNAEGKIVPELKLFVDGNLIGTTNTLYGSSYYTDGVLNSDAVPAPSDMNEVKFTISNSVNSGMYYFDDFYFAHLKEEDIEVPHEHVYVDGKCECGAEDPDYVPEPEDNTVTFDQAYEDVLTIVTNANYADKNTWTVVDVEGDKKLYVEKQGKDTSGTTYLGGVSFQIGVTEREENPTIMVYEFDMQIKDATAFDNQITMGHQGVVGNGYTPFLYTIKGFEANTDYHITLTYKVTATDASGIPTAIEYTVYVNDNDPITSNTVHPKATKLKVNGGTYELPTVAQVENVTFALNNSFLGNVYFDNFRLALLAEWAPEVPEEHEHVYVDGKCECGAEDPDYVAPDTSVLTFDSMPEESVLKIASPGFTAEGVVGENTWTIATVEGSDNKVLYIKKGANGKNEAGTELNTNCGVSHTLKVTKTEEDANVAVFESKFLLKNITGNSGIQLRLYGASTTAANAPVMIWLTTGSKTADGSEFTYADYANGVMNKDSQYYGVNSGATIGEWFTLRIEYRVTETDESGKPTAIEYRTYIDGNLVATSSAIYGKNIVAGTYALPKASEITTSIFAFNNAYLGDFYLDDMSLQLLHEDPEEVPEPVDNTVTFDGDYSSILTIYTNPNFAELNTWTVVDVDGDKKLFIDKAGKDTSGTSWNGGVSLTIKVTKTESAPKVAVLSFDLNMTEITAVDSQITMNHNGKTGKNYSPFLLSLPKGADYRNKELHYVITYEVTATDDAGVPTEIKYSMQIGDEDPVVSTTVYDKAGSLVQNGGTVNLPKVSEIDSIIVALNNSFLGDAYFDNIKLELLNEYEVHVHEFVEGKCECGKVDPDYVPPVLKFDEMPAAELFAITTGNAAEAPYAIGENKWEIVAVEGTDNKVLHISKNCNGKLNEGYVDSSGNPKTSTSNWGVSTKTYVTSEVADANVAVFEAKILLENITSNSGIQLRLYGASTTAANCPAQFYFDTASGADGTEFRYSHSYNNAWDKDETLGNYRGLMGAYIGEWFTLRIEYRVLVADENGTPTEIEYRTYVDNKCVWVSGRVYGANINNGTANLPKVSEISMMSLAFNNGYIGDFYLDDMSLQLIHEEPHDHNFVKGVCDVCGVIDPTYHEHVFVDGKCECGEADPDYVPEHTHVFVDGKCECGEADPDWVEPAPEPKEETALTFDEMPANVTFSNCTAEIAADPANGENKALVVAGDGVTKAICFDISADKDDYDVAIAEYKMLWTGVNSIKAEFMLVSGASDKTNWVSHNYFSNGKLYIYPNNTEALLGDGGIGTEAWFTVRIEYRVIEVDGVKMPEVTYKINDTIIGVDNGLAGTGYYADGVLDSSKIPAPSEITQLRVQISSGVSSGSVYIDDVVFMHNYDSNEPEVPAVTE